MLAACIRLDLDVVEEYSRQLIILFGRDRVDLVVVATRTSDRQGKERLTGRRHHVVEGGETSDRSGCRSCSDSFQSERNLPRSRRPAGEPLGAPATW